MARARLLLSLPILFAVLATVPATHQTRPAAAVALRPPDSPGEAAEHFLRHRGLDRRPPQVNRAYAAVRDATRAGRYSSRSIGSSDAWQYLGPGNIGGRVRAIAIDPSAASVMYAGGVAGGVWKTTNSGATWAPLTDSAANLAVTSIVISPVDHNTVYAATGELEGTLHSSVPGGGVLRSTDAGSTWSFLTQTKTDNFILIGRLAISADGTRIYAATNHGVMRSGDGGTTWTTALDRSSQPYGEGCTDVDIVTTDTTPNPDVDTLLASCGAVLPDGIYRSTDSGSNWSNVEAGTTFAATPFGTADIAVAPSDHSRVYATAAGSKRNAADTAANPGREQLVGVLRSNDGGATWTRVATAPNVFGNCVFPTGSSQGAFDNAVAVDPTNKDRIWVGGVDVYVSSDAGATLRRVTSWFLQQTDPTHPARYVHADQHTVVFAPDYATSHKVLLGNDGGVFQTTDGAAAVSADVTCNTGTVNPPGPMTWTSIVNGLGISQFYDGIPEPAGGGYFGGLQDNGGIYGRQIDGTNGWAPVHGGDGGIVGIEPDPAIFGYYTEFPQMDFQRVSADRSTLIPAATGPTELYASAGPSNPNDTWDFINPFTVDPTSPGPGLARTIWTGGNGVWRSTNRGLNWSRVIADLDGGGANSGLVSALAVKPNDPNTLYVGTLDGQLWRSTNAAGGAPTFARVDAAHLPPSTSNPVSAIAIAPDGRVWVTYQAFGNSYVFKSDAAGTTFADSDPSITLPVIPFNTIALNPLHSNEVYIGTDASVYQSADTGATWTLATKNLANTIVASLRFQPNTEILYAFTHGRGAWRVKAGPQADVVRPTYTSSTTTAGTTITFSEDVRGVSSSSVFMRLADAPATTVAGAITGCKNAAGSTVSCGGPVRAAVFAATTPLVLGQRYQTVATAAVTDAYGNQVSGAVHNVRLVSEQDNGRTPVYQWRNLASSPSYGGYTRVEAMAGATYHLKTTSRSVVWYTIKGPSQGKASVYVNGTRVLTDVDNRSSTTTYRYPRTIPFTGVANAASYDIAIVVKGPASGSTDTSKTKVHVDAFKVAGTLIQNPTNNVAYRWRGVTYTSGRHVYVTDMTNAAMTLKFRGTLLNLRTVTGPTQGKMRVKIDGTTYPDIDNYAAATHYDVIRTFSPLTNTVHTLTLTALGTKNASATAAQVTVDSFAVS